MNSDLKYAMFYDNLDGIIDAMGITAHDTGLPPITDEERAVIKIQIIVAQIIARDVNKIFRHDYNTVVPHEKLVDELVKNWEWNIKNFTKTILSNNNFQISIENILKDIQKKY